jgi:hypothetical protein
MVKQERIILGLANQNPRELEGPLFFFFLAIEVLDKNTNETTTYDSISSAARDLNIKQSEISKYFARNQQKPYKGRYTFQKISSL